MADRLRVGMLAPIAWSVPPRHYGPWERVVSILTEGLVARGVEVTLFATADSTTRARLMAVAPRGYAEDPSLDAKVYECLHVGAAFEQAAAGSFDILHNHFDFLPLTYSRLVPTPVVTTVHGFSSCTSTSLRPTALSSSPSWPLTQRPPTVSAARTD